MGRRRGREVERSKGGEEKERRRGEGMGRGEKRR